MIKLRTKPQFLLTNKVPLTIYRTTGSGRYEMGEWVEPESEPIEREVNIQPLRFKEAMLLPEAERTRQWWTLYCAEDLRADQEAGIDPETGEELGGWRADEFVWQGYRYKIMKVKNFSMGILDHFHAQAARIEVTPN